MLISTHAKYLSRIPILRCFCSSAHELGHIVLHIDDSSVDLYNEAGILDNSSAKEREAYLFAAEYILEYSDIFDALSYDFNTVSQAAARLRIPVGLLLLKLEILNYYGADDVENDSLYDLEIPNEYNINY